MKREKRTDTSHETYMWSSVTQIFRNA